jgi:hypothetical protein
MADTNLSCALALTPLPDGDIGLTFHIRNAGRELARISYYEPFTDFDLAVEATDGAVPLVQPHYDIPVRPVTRTLGVGQIVQLNTPIRLRFDPTVPPSGGTVSTRWSLRHAPAAVTIRATVRVNGATIAPCETRYDPERSR